MGDFNEVRWEHERFSSVFNHAQANHFNEFIFEVELVDIPLGGYMFTWSHSSDSKTSKIDMFLISDGLLSIFSKLSGLILTRHLSDHKPLLLQEAHFDYGATPFRVFHSWFLETDFAESKSKVDERCKSRKMWQAKLEEIDKRVDDGHGAANDLQKRKQIMKLLLEVDRKETLDLAQKVKVKWDIEGDENNKYFHEIINKRKHHLAIRGILIDGEWVDNPIQVKQEFYHHFATRFEAPKWSRAEVLDTFPNRLSSDQSRVMEEDVSYDEVKRAVWECGSDNTLVRWDFIDDILHRFCFGECWMKWIQGCFTPCMGSILVNGSPTDEFRFQRGLRQGDPLSPFLFLLVMESLHITSMFLHGINFNFHKSTLLGIDVPYHEVECIALSVGCKSEKLPFNYLGVKIGENMSRIESWKEVISKVSNKLSSWKIKTLSVGGRLTLLKLVLGSLPTYYMSIYKAPQAVVKSLESIRNRFFIDANSDERKTTWISWKKVLASKREGSLRVNSIFALNHALLFKWVWRFRMQSNAIWTKVVRAIHGLDLMEFCQKKVGDGQGTRFWLDKWVGDQTLKEAYPRIFALELDKEIKVAVKLEQIDGLGSYRRLPRGGIEEVQMMELRSAISSIIMAPVPDRWVWTLDGSRSFTVGSARVYIDKKLLISDKLPTRMNLDVRGFDVPSILCPICGEVAKNSDHFFFQCSFVSQVYELFGRWWDIQIPMLTSF
ncbi:RNA-directed DNA polymerase, eukaryota [Tanacetum coccineum]